MTTSEQATPAATPADDSRVIYKEYENSNGKKYRAGYGIPDTEDLEAARVTVANFKDPNSPPAASFGVMEVAQAKEKIIIEVDWPYYNDDQFHDPGAEAKSRIGIDGFKLDWNTGGYFNYKLTINASEKWDYTFYDQDGDHYTIDVNCIWWSHDVCFDTDHNK
ncbi:hypothetical protein BJ165DRAFT_1132155 [Panaeolus papilionaceus]|nr:hypothetical protein BJ165DRAFT_1132155 [Panaeolus papilionaceus]